LVNLVRLVSGMKIGNIEIAYQSDFVAGRCSVFEKSNDEFARE